MCCSGKAGNPKKDDKTPSEGPQEVMNEPQKPEPTLFPIYLRYLNFDVRWIIYIYMLIRLLFCLFVLARNPNYLPERVYLDQRRGGVGEEGGCCCCGGVGVEFGVGSCERKCDSHSEVDFEDVLVSSAVSEGGGFE